jgi:hypothetical protein
MDVFESNLKTIKEGLAGFAEVDEVKELSKLVYYKAEKSELDQIINGFQKTIVMID